jgi:hypothetical protein
MRDSIICRFARAVLKMENLHKVRGLAHAVIGQNRSMHQLAPPRPPFNQAADVREAFEKLDMIKEGDAEPLGAGGKVHPRVGEDFLTVY